MAQIQRFDWADFMRGLMMFMVVLYHSEVYYGSGHTLSWVFEPVFLTGFFFISGYLFTRDLFKVSLKEKVKQIIRAIIIPYFIFTVGLSLPKIIISKTDSIQLIIDIITLRASWFVIAIGMMQIIYAIVLSKYKSVLALSISTFIMFGLGYLSVLVYRESPSWLNNPWLNSPNLPNRLPLCLNLALVQSLFFYLGILYRKYEASWNIPMSKTALIVSSSLYCILYLWLDHIWIGSRMVVAIHRYNNILLVFLYAIIAIWMLMCISRLFQYSKPINFIGKHSILFYFLNGSALTFVAGIIKKFSFIDSSLYINQIIVAVLATALMFPVVWFINKYIPLISGNKESFNRLSKKLGLNINW